MSHVAAADDQARQATARQRTPLHELYCFKCKCPRKAAFKAAEYRQTSGTSGQLTALCEVCATVMHKAARRADLEVIRAKIEVTIKPGQTTLVSSAHRTSNGDFGRETGTHG